MFSYKVAELLNLSSVPNTVDYILFTVSISLVAWIGSNLLNKSEQDKDFDSSETIPSEQVEENEIGSPENKLEAIKSKEAEISVPEISWDKRLFKGLSKTRSEIWGKIGSMISGKKIDDALIEELEEILFTSDLSPALVDELLEELKNVDSDENTNYLEHIKTFMQQKMKSAQDSVNKELYSLNADNNSGLKVIMIVGVNGAGKTTTIGKLATKLKRQGAKVVVGACDTFRAAAVEQLEVWCNRAEVDIVKAAEGADPSGVAYDTVAKAKEIGADYCIIDTAGRLHTKSNLMDELAKTKKVMSKIIPDAPHETLLVVDAITGQNALRQAEEFNKALALSGLIFTKCDGSSKAGSAVGIVNTLQVPIVYIGVGEDVEDLDIFNLDNFLDALLGITV